MDWTALFHNPAQLFEAYVLYAVVSSAVSALPAPSATSGMFYEWFYKFANGAMGSLKQISLRQVEGPEVVKPPAEVKQ